MALQQRKNSETRIQWSQASAKNQKNCTQRVININQIDSAKAAILLLHQQKKEEKFPWRMPLYPLPAIVGIVVWLFIFYTAELQYKLFALGIIVSGIILYFLFIRNKTNATSI